MIRRTCLWPIAGLVVVVLCACHDEAAAPAPPAVELASMEFSTSSSIAGNPPPPVHVVVTDPSSVQDAYRSTLALPDLPSGALFCPLDLGIHYELTFSYADGRDPLQVSLQPGGCRKVQIPGMPDKRVLGDSYWSELASDLGIEESTIYPYVRASIADAGE